MNHDNLAAAVPLFAREPAVCIPEEDDIYGPLIGGWDFLWTDGHDTPEERHVDGEWLFSRILEGRAVQDVFICPSRTARKLRSYHDAAYGTTVRNYLPKERVWEVVYFERGACTRLIGTQAANGDIVQSMTGENGFAMEWIFSGITADSFRWTNRTSRDGGASWKLTGELSAVRRREQG